MNQNRAQRYVTALLAAILLFALSTIGSLVDQAAGVTLDRALLVQFQDCLCLEAGVPLAVDVFRANVWTITGAVTGLLLGLAIGWGIRLAQRDRGGQPRRFSSFRQASELARFSQALSDTLEPQRILARLHTEVMHVTGADCGSSFLLDPSSPEHRVPHRTGEGAELVRLNPMEATAVSTARSRIVQDFEAEGEPPPHVGIRSALLVPITHEENAIGLIHLHSQTPNAFDSEFHDFVQVLAAQAAVAINNAQRYEEQSRRSEALRQRVNQLQQLSQIPSSVRVDRPLAANLESIAQAMQDTAGFGFTLIYVFAPEANHLALAAAAGVSPEMFTRLQQQPAPWERLQPFLREEFRSNRVYAVPHGQTAEAYRALELGQPRNADRPRQPGQWHPDELLLVPLYASRGEIEGLLAVSAPREADTPQNVVLEMLEVFAGQAALAIENAHLLAQAEERVTESQERAVQLGALTEATGLIAASLRVDEVITLGLDQLRRVVPYDTATFWRRDLSEGRWRVASARSYQEAIERVIERAERTQPALFGEIAATRSVMFVADVSRDVRFSAKDISSMRGWLGVPVLTGGEVTGILALEKAEDGFYGAGHVPVALSFANRLAVALENARLYEESVQHAREMEARGQRLGLLNRNAGDLSAARDVPAVLRVALQALHEALETASAAGVLFETDVPQSTPAVLAQDRLPAQAGAPTLNLEDNPLLKRLADTGTHLLVDAERPATDNPARPEHLAWVGAATVTALYLPLLADNRLVGVLGLGHAAGGRFASGDVDLAWAVAQQAVLAVQNLRLREKTQEQTLINQVTRTLSRAADRTELYDLLREELGGAAHVQTFTLALYDQSRNLATFPLVVENGAAMAATTHAEPRPPTGLVRYIVQNRQAVRLAGDVTAQADALGIPLILPAHHPVRGRSGPAEAPLAKAYLGVPLLLGEQVLGALVAEDQARPEAFGDQHERLLAAAATQTAIALENIQLYEQARQGLAAVQARAEELEALAEVTVGLAGAQRTEDVVAAALAQGRRLLPYDRANVWLKTTTGRRAPVWRLSGTRGDASAPGGAAQSFEAGTPLGDAAATRRVTVVPDTGQDARFGGASRAWLAAPLVSGDEVVGVLEFVAGEAGAFSTKYTGAAQALTSRMTAALENARRIEAGAAQAESLDQRAQRLALLNQAAQALARPQEVETLLATTARLAAEALNVSLAGSVLFATETSDLRAARQPGPHPGDRPAAAAALSAQTLLERVAGVRERVTLAELSAIRPVPVEQTEWVGGGAATALFAPLVADGQVLGVLAVGTTEADHAFSEADRELAANLADLASAALQVAIQQEQAQLRLSEQSTINQISRALSRTLDLRELLASVNEQMAAWLNPKTLQLALYDETRHEVNFPLAVRQGQPQDNPPGAPQGFLRLVLQEQKPILATNAAPERLEALGLSAEALGEANALLGVPLVANGQLLGALTLSDPQAAPTLTESHARILNALAGQIAVTLENARRHEQVQQSAVSAQARAAEAIASTRAEAEEAIAAARAQAQQTVTTTEARAAQAVTAAQERAYQAEGLAEAFGVVTAAQRVDEVLDRALAQLSRLLPYAGVTYWRRGPGLEQAWVPTATRRTGRTDDSPAPAPLPPALAREVVASRAPVLVPDMSRDERFPGNGSRRAAAWLGVPVIGQAEFVGVLAVEAEAPNAYQPSQVRLAQNFAQQTGVALENAGQHEASLRRAQEYEERGTLLGNIAVELTSTLDLDGLLPLVLRQVTRALRADCGGLVVFDPATAEPRPAAVRGLAQLPPASADMPAPQVSGNPVIERLRDTQRPLVIEDLEGEKLIRREHLAWAGEGFWSGLLLPLTHQGQVLGVLGLGNKTARTWTAPDVDLALAMVVQAAAAVHNAQQYAEVQERLQEQTVVAQIIRAVSRAGDVRSLTEVLRARLSAWLSADSLYLALYDEAHNEITFPLLIDSGQTRAAAACAPGGLLRHVLQTRRTLHLSGDIGQQCRDLGIAVSYVTQRPQRWAADAGEALTAQSYLAAPVLLGEKVLGVLAVEVNGRTEAFTERHERILSTIAAQTAVILDNTRLYEETRLALAAAQERVAQLEILTTALSTLAAVLYSDDAVGVALEQFQRVIPYDRATFWQREAAGGPGRDMRWRLMGARGQPETGDRVAGPDAAQQTLFGEMVLGRRVIYVPDTARDGRFAAMPQHLTRSWMGVPLVSKGDVIAIVALEKVEANAFDANQAAPAQVLANQVTAVLGNARQFEANVQRVVELDERARRLAFLNRFGAELGASLDLSQILRLSVKALTEALGVEHGAAAAFDEQRTTLLALEQFPASATAGGPMGQLLLPGNTLLERLQETPAPIAVEDLSATEGAARLRSAEWVGAEVRAAMFVPLMHSGRLVGLVGLGQAQPGRRFTPDEMELSMALANQAAAAVHMARQHDRTQQRLAEQATINQIMRAFSQAQDVRTLCEVLRQQVEAWIRPERLYLATYAEERNEVSFPLAVEQGELTSLAPRAPSGLVRHLIQHQQPVRLNGEIAQQLRNLGIYVTGLGSAVGLEDAAEFTAYLGVPVATGERVAGALILAGPRRAEAFDESHERILSAVAGQLAAALETARQHEQALALTAAAQTRAAQLSELTDATSAIASAQRSEQVVTLTLDQLQRLIPYDSVQFWRRESGRNGTGGTEQWRLAAARGARTTETGRILEPAALQRSPLAEVLSTKGPLVVGDTALDERFERAGAWLGIPLIHSGEVLGLLALDKGEAGAFTQAMLPMAQAFGKQAAVSLANVRMYEESLQRAQELDERTTVLNRASAAFGSLLEPQGVLQNALAALTELLHVDRGAALVLEDSRTATRARAQAVHPPEQNIGASLSLTGNVVLDQLRESLAPLAVEAVAADPVVTTDHTAWIAPDLTAALFLPLVVAGRLRGVLGFGVLTGRRRFAPSEIDLAMTLANQAAIALHNARLYQRTQRRMVELATISQSSRAISQTIDLAQLYETVRAQVETSLRADSLYLALYDEARREVTYPLAIERGQPVEVEPRAPDRLISHILATRQSLLLTGDIPQKLAEAGVAPGAEVRAKAYLGVPLVLGTKVRGVLAVEDYQRAYAFTDKHERALAGIAAPVAAAVDGARIYQESAQRALALDARAALLGRLAAELNESLELIDVLRVTARVVTETLLADVGGAIALDEAPDALLAAAIARYPDDDRELQSPVMAGNPVVERLAENLSPLALDDVTTDVTERAALTQWLGVEVQSALFLPLATAERLMGFVAVGHRHPERSFTPGEVDLALTIASQTSVALANARAQQKLQPRLAELATISHINQVIGQPASLSQLCDSLRVEIGGALQAEVLYLALYDETQNSVSFPLFAEGGQARVATARPPAGALALILNERQPLRLNGDVAEQLAARGAAHQPLAADLAEPRSLLGVPLVAGKRVLGALVVEDYAQAGRFGPSQEFILSTVATPIAVAVENARLHAERTRTARELEMRAAQLALTRRLSTKLQGAADPIVILRLTLDELQDTLGAAHAAAGLSLDLANSTWRVVRPTTSGPADQGGATSVTPAGLHAWLRSTGGPASVYALAEETRFPASDLNWVAAALESAVVLPVRVGGDVAGALVLGESGTPRVYDQGEVDLAVMAANQAAVAIELAWLYVEAHQAHRAAAARAEQLRLAALAAERIRAAVTPDGVMAAALDELPQVVPFDSATLWVTEPNDSDGHLRAAATRGSARAGLTTMPAEQPALAETLANGVTRVPDTQADSRFRGASTTGRSWLGAALRHNSEPLGILVLEKAEANFYQPEHAALAGLMGSHVAEALDNARRQAANLARFEELLTQANRVALLHRVTLAVNRTLDMRGVLTNLLTEFIAALGAEQGAALLFAEAEAGQPQPVLVQAPAQSTAAPLPGPGHPWWDRLNAGQAVVVEDTAAERLRLEQLAWLGSDAKSVMALPLRAGDHWMGLVGVGQTRERRQFTAAEVALGQDMAGQLAGALANARQHQRVERQLVEQQTWNQMQQALAAARDVPQISEALREALRTILQADTYYLALFNAAADEVAFVLLVEGGQPREVRPLPPEGVIDHILQTRQTLRLTGDVSHALKELGLAHKGSRARRETGDPSASRAYVGAPLLDGERVLGVLAVEDAQRADAFGDAQVAWLESMARDASAAVARLRGQAEGARAAAELDQYRTQFAQASQAAQAFEQQLQTRAREFAALQERYVEAVRTAEALDQQSRARGKHAAEARARYAQAAAAARDLAESVAQQGEALREWRARAQAAIAAQSSTPLPNLPAQLERELLVASRALGAEYAVLYLAGEDPTALALSASVGEAGPTAEGDPHALALSALQTQAPVFVAQLEADARWNATVAGAASGPQAEANGRYHSGLAVPVPAAERGQPSGAVVFLSARADGFDPASAPVARAAASQLAYALQSDHLARDLRAQTARFRELLNEPVTRWAPEAVLPDLPLEPLPEEAEIPVPALAPISTSPAAITPETTQPIGPVVAEPTRPLTPAWQPPLPEPALAEAAAADIPEIQRPAARPLWRRAAIPAAIVLAAVCGLAALARGPLSNMAAGLLGGATSTAPAATQTAPVVLAASATPDAPVTIAPTDAPTTAAPPTPTTPPPTATRTAAPTETETPAETSTPTITPTPPLPPDVVAVALVDLPEGIGGRLRDAPNGNVIGGVPGNTQVHVLAGRETTSDGIVWVQIRIPDTGQAGWFAEDLLIYENEPGG